MVLRTRRSRRRTSVVRKRTMVRRRNIKRRSFRKRRSLVPRPRSIGQIFPDRLRVKMVYTVPAFYCSSSSNTSETVMRGNNVYDPEYATGGHQPMGYDNFASAYRNYYVSSSKCSAAMFNLGNAANNPTRMYIICTTDAANLIGTYTETEIDENIRNKIKWTSGILNQQDWGYRAMWRSTKAMLSAPGRTSIEAMGATDGSTGPSDVFFFHIIAFTVNGQNFTLSTNQICIRMTYWVEFSERLFQHSN